MALHKEKHTILKYGVLLLALFYLLYLRYHFIFNYSPDVSGSEKNIIYGIQRLLDGQSLYSDPTLIEFNLIQYPPLYFRLIYFVCIFLNIGLEDPHTIYITSRICSLVFVALSAFIYASILKRYSLNYMQCASAAILILFVHSADMLTNSRPDSLLSFLIACFLYTGIRYIETTNSTWNFLAILSLVLAIWTKQTGVVLLMCWFIMMVITGLHKQNLYNILIYIILISALLFIERTDIRILKLNLIDGVKNGISFEEFHKWILFKLWPLLPILALSLIFCFKWLSGRSVSPPTTKQFIALTCSLLFFFNLLASLKQGARIGYLTDFFCIAIVGIYIFINEQQKVKNKAYRIILAGCWIITVVYFGTFSTLFAKDCKDAAHLGMYNKEKSLARYIEEKYISAHPKARIIVLESFFKGIWVKQFLFRHTSAFASDALSMTPLDYSRFPEYIKSREIRYLIRFKPTRLESLGYPLREAKLIDSYDNVEIYCLSGNQQTNSKDNFISSVTY